MPDEPYVRDAPADIGGAPMLRIVRGHPDEVELAALVAAMSVLPATQLPAGQPAAPGAGAPAAGGWAAYWRCLGVRIPTAAGAWAASAWRG